MFIPVRKDQAHSPLLLPRGLRLDAPASLTLMLQCLMITTLILLPKDDARAAPVPKTHPPANKAAGQKENHPARTAPGQGAPKSRAHSVESGGEEAIRVTGAGSVRAAEARLRKVPGTFAVISSREVEKGRAATLEDTLAFQPGIFAQATTGSTGNKISIRGSGAGVFYGGYSLGMKYLVDGLAVSGVGGFQEDRLNTTGYQRTEVLYGANAFDYAATAMGGGINFITHTGNSAPGFMAHFEAGSYGTLKEQVSQGGTFDNRRGDYYVTVARTNRQGFQTDTAMYRTDVVANLGYHITDKLQTRLIFR